MDDVAEACQLMKQALEILDAQGEHRSAGMLDMAIHALPGEQASTGGSYDLDAGSNQL
jgi:hypothetical protein